MRFPRGYPSKSISVNLNSMQPELPSYDISIPANFCAADMRLLEKLVTFSRDIAVDNKVHTYPNLFYDYPISFDVHNIVFLYSSLERFVPFSIYSRN